MLKKTFRSFFIVVFACRTNGFVFPSFLNCPNLCLILLPFSLIYFLVLRGPEVLNLTMKEADLLQLRSNILTFTTGHAASAN